MEMKGFKRSIREIISGDEIYNAESRWVLKERIIDRENDNYSELVTDPDTGTIIHECKGAVLE